MDFNHRRICDRVPSVCSAGARISTCLGIV
jgi:hypothetical protein